MEAIQISVFESVLSGVMLAAVIGIWAMLRKFIKEQRGVNEANRAFTRSMQRAEISRYFRLVVEEGKPISTEEMSHLAACYEAYHSGGGNDTGTLMYERIRQHARLVTIHD